MLAAEAVVEALSGGKSGDELTNYDAIFKASWLYEELVSVKNFSGMMHSAGGIVGGLVGTLIGSGLVWIDQTLFGGKFPIALRDKTPDYSTLLPAAQCKKIAYPKPDNKITFDRLTSVFLSNTNHEEDQPCHLTLRDKDVPIKHNLPLYDEPAQRYCPAGVYEVVTNEDGSKRFQINGQNCVHCKTCDIKDPAQNIVWVTPEGGGGPNYPNM